MTRVRRPVWQKERIAWPIGFASVLAIDLGDYRGLYRADRYYSELLLHAWEPVNVGDIDNIR